jgi:hypothetical protein
VAALAPWVDHLQAHGVAVEPVRVDEFTGRRFTFFADPDGLPLELYEEGRWAGRGRLSGAWHAQTLNRKFSTSPSLTTYSLPSARILPASLAPCSPLY